MVATTPFLPDGDKLGPLASRFLNVAELPWQETRFPGVDMKVLVEDKDTGLVTALFRFGPGTKLPYHEHVAIEQTWVLEGTLEDEEGIAIRRQLRLAPGRQSPQRAFAERLPRALDLPETQQVPRQGHGRLGHQGRDVTKRRRQQNPPQGNRP